MRLLTGAMLGATLTIAWNTFGSRVLAWVFTRIEPETPPDWAPKLRGWEQR